MWSRTFLVVGLLIGLLMAAAALGGIWLALHAASGFTYPSYGSIVGFGIGGIVVYPVCWAIMIHRTRDYSARRTYFLVAVTYTAAATLTIAVILLGLTYHAVIMGSAFLASPEMRGVVLFIPWALFLVVVFGFIAAGLVGVFYLIVATPIAFLHRAVMLWLFNSGTEATSAHSKTAPL
jgi:hypothetical protein